MQDRIFTIENNQVVINENCLLIPELKAVVDNYEKPVPALAYVYYMTSIVNPYSELDKDFKQEQILKDYPGDYKPTDEIIIKALDKCDMLYEKAIIKYYESIKGLIYKLQKYNDTVIIDDSKETGNIQHVLKMVEKCGQVIIQFKKAEKERDQELLKTRGNHELAYDQR